MASPDVSEFQDFLDEVREDLNRFLVVNTQLLISLVAKKVITKEERLEIEAQVGKLSKTDLLLEIVSARPGKLNDIIKILDQSLQSTPAKIFKRFLVPESGVHSSNNSITPSATAAGTNTRTFAIKRTATDSVKNSLLSYKVTNVEDPLLVSEGGETFPQDGSTGTDGNVIEGKPLTEPRGLNRDSWINASAIDEFKVGNYVSPTEKKKRVALVINNFRFEGRPKAERAGASHDTHHFTYTLTKYCNFDVYSIDNCTSRELDTNLPLFIQEAEGSEACIVSVMSHGDDKNCVLMSDNKWIPYWSRIVQKFNNTNCPTLKGVPKMFFFQFCRGDTTDLGVIEHDALDDDDNYDIPFTIPSWTDMLVAYSTLEGHFSYRNRKEGSWFIQILCHVIRKYGAQHDICKLLNIVSTAVQYQTGCKGEKQICPYYNIGFTKEFYLMDTR